MRTGAEGRAPREAMGAASPGVAPGSAHGLSLAARCWAGVRSRPSLRFGPLALACLLGGFGAVERGLAEGEAGSGQERVFLLDSGEDSFGSSVNTLFDEREPVLSRDGRLLLFASNRGGAYHIVAVALASPFPGPSETPAPLHFVPAARGDRPLPEVPWLGGPGQQRSPCLCERAAAEPGRYELTLFYRSEEDWGAGLYAAEVQAALVQGAAGEERLVLSTGAVRPLLQDLGLRLQGPWWVPEGAWAGPGAILLARGGGRWLGWRVQGCSPEPLEERQLLAALPELNAAETASSLAWAGLGQLLVARPGARDRLDFGWAAMEAFPLSRSFAGDTVNTDGWNELEAAFGPEVDGERLMVFSRDASLTRRDANLFYTWLGRSR
jgi:WD40 repeat protein